MATVFWKLIIMLPVLITYWSLIIVFSGSSGGSWVVNRLLTFHFSFCSLVWSRRESNQDLPNRDYHANHYCTICIWFVWLYTKKPNGIRMCQSERHVCMNDCVFCELVLWKCNTLCCSSTIQASLLHRNTATYVISAYHHDLPLLNGACLSACTSIMFFGLITPGIEPRPSK
jgi:hypothetical protein